MGEKIFIAKEDTSQQILAQLLGQRPKRYGFRVKISEPDPKNRVEYIYDAQDMTPAHMDFGDKRFEYGDWKDVWFVKNNFPCMVKANGVVDYQLDPNDYTKRADNGEESDVDKEDYPGNAMSAIPCVWYKRWTDGDYYYFVACEEQYDESFYADVHTDKNGVVQPYKYVAMFKGSLHDGVLRSVSGMKIQTSAATTAAVELGYAKANGDAWTILEWGVWCLVADLLTLIGKSTDTQAIYGEGHTIGNSLESDLLLTGTLYDKGQFYGYNDRLHAVKVFHMENWWGERWDRIVGMVVDHGVVKVKINSYGGDYNFEGENFEIVGNILPDNNGFQTREYSGRLGTFPTESGGSLNSYECDSVYVNKEITAVARVGGAVNFTSNCGARCLNCSSAAGSTSWQIGASLSLKNPT